MASLFSLAAELSALSTPMVDWALMIAGFGGAGAMLRRVRTLVAA